MLAAIRRGVRVYDLGRPMFPGMPQSPNHPPFAHSLPRRHGDVTRADGGSAANDLIVTGTHVGTHIDALAHVSQDGRLHGGADAREACVGGRYPDHGVHLIEPIVCRGVLLDVARTLGVDCCPAAYEITDDDLATCVKTTGVAPARGDVALVRTGWGPRFDDGAEAYLGHRSGVPGAGASAAAWLVDHGVVAAGSDTIAFERIRPGNGHAVLPVHSVLLVEHGIHIIEALDLESLSSEEIYEFTFVVAPLKLVGATGSPVRPIALVGRG